MQRFELINERRYELMMAGESIPSFNESSVTKVFAIFRFIPQKWLPPDRSQLPQGEHAPGARHTSRDSNTP